MVGLSAAAIVMVASSILLLWITIYIVHRHERRTEQLLRKIDLCGKAENLLLKVEAQYRLRNSASMSGSISPKPAICWITLIRFSRM